MYIEFDKDYLRELYAEGKASDKKGISSVRINKKYRLEFTVREVQNEQVVTFCRLLDISNHYK